MVGVAGPHISPDLRAVRFLRSANGRGGLSSALITEGGREGSYNLILSEKLPHKQDRASTWCIRRTR